MHIKRNTIVRKLERPTLSHRNLGGEFWERKETLPFDYYVYSIEERLEDYKKRPVQEGEYLAGSRTKDHLTDFLIDIFDKKPILIFNATVQKNYGSRAAPFNMDRLARTLSHKFDEIIHVTKKEFPNDCRTVEQYHLLKTREGGTFTRPFSLLTFEYRSRRRPFSKEGETKWREGCNIRLLDLAEWEKLYNRSVLYITTWNRPSMEVMSLMMPSKLVCIEPFEKYMPIN
jgi:hypothetical protein